MHLLQAGVNLVYIRDILGHVSVQTTEIYARADSKQKRDALEKAYVNINPYEEPIWTKNENLIDWLKNFKILCKVIINIHVDNESVNDSTLHNHLLYIMCQDDAGSIVFQSDLKNNLWISHCPAKTS